MPAPINCRRRRRCGVPKTADLTTTCRIGDTTWRCECNTLHGIQNGPCLHLKYKEKEFFVIGGQDTIVAICPKCSRTSKRIGARESGQQTVSDQ
jgi:hypothetical protein